MRKRPAKRTKNFPPKSCPVRALGLGIRHPEPTVRRNPILSALAGLIGLVLYVSFGMSSGATDERAVLGTWTDEKGSPNNSIRFYLVPHDLPGMPGATALEGHVTVVECLGRPTGTGQWNFGSLDPLVLNILDGGMTVYLAIRKLDDDHLLVRIGTDPEEIMSPGALDHPDTRTLTRVAREP
jgi:hypothetical protein